MESKMMICPEWETCKTDCNLKRPHPKIDHCKYPVGACPACIPYVEPVPVEESKEPKKGVESRWFAKRLVKPSPLKESDGLLSYKDTLITEETYNSLEHGGFKPYFSEVDTTIDKQAEVSFNAGKLAQKSLDDAKIKRIWEELERPCPHYHPLDKMVVRCCPICYAELKAKEGR